MIRRENYKTYVVILGFTLFGLLVGVWSYAVDNDIGYAINFIGSSISDELYNKVLLPYWKDTLTPDHYERLYRHIENSSGEFRVPFKSPVYEFPVKRSHDLVLPVSILVYFVIGVSIQWMLNVTILNKHNKT